MQRQRNRPARPWPELARLARFPWIAGALLLALLVGVDTDAGRGLLARILTAASGGKIIVQGIGGELPFRPRIARLELTDADGVWLRATDLALVLRPATLLRGEVDIEALTIDRLELARLPRTGDGIGLQLPAPVRLQRLVIAQLATSLSGTSLPPPVMTGTATLVGTGVDADLLLSVPGREDRYRLTLAPAAQGHRMSVAISEAADGPLAALAGSSGVPLPPGFADWTLNAQLLGPLDAAVVDVEIASGPYRAELSGAADLSAGALQLKGRIDLAAPSPPSATRGVAPTRLQAPWDSLLGNAVQLALTVRRDGRLWAIDRGRLDARLLDLELAGRLGADLLDLSWVLELTAPNVFGSTEGVGLNARGQVTGTPGLPRIVADLALQRATTAARGGTAGDQVRGRLQIEPMTPRARLVLTGRWGGEPITGDLTVGPIPDGVLELRLGEIRWSGATLTGHLRQATGARLPSGDLRLRISDLAASKLQGDLDIHARGPIDGVEIEAEARLRRILPDFTWLGDIRMAAAGRLDAQTRRLALRRLTADTKGRRLRLLAPADVDLAGGVTLQSLRIGLATADAAGGELELTGQIHPSLSLNGRLAGLDLTAVAPWLPAAGVVRGLVDAEAELGGSASAPTGRIDLRARALGLTDSPWRGLPPAAARLTATFDGVATRLDAEAWIDERARLALDGHIAGAPWSTSTPLGLRGHGRLDLALLDVWLGASGRRAEGRVGLDLSIGGTRIEPRLDGRLRLANGLWSDRRLGLWLNQIDGDAQLRGQRLQIERLLATAGSGTLALDGNIDWSAPAGRVDLRLRARDAEPIRLDLVQLRGDADMTLGGALEGALSLIGDLRFARVDIRLPERLPPDIPTLDVIERGERRQPRPPRHAATAGSWRDRLQLDVRIAAPRTVMVRGRNIDAELGGDLRLHGSAAAPTAEGALMLLRGEYQLIGQSLRFTRGRIGLDGADLFDPTLDFEARAQSPGATAILSVEGRVRSPRVVLRGEPPMSDDEVLSRLLFGVAPARLSAFQLTRLGLAATSLAGLGVDEGRLLERARSGLALGSLRIDSDRRGGAVIEGGRDLTERVYLGARQGVTGGEPRAVLGLQVAPQIRLESDVGGRGAGAGAAFELDY